MSARSNHGTAFDPSGFDPHDPAFLADPYPTYARFREAAPISVVAPYATTWAFRAADVRTVLDDKATFVKRAGPLTHQSSAFGMSANLPTGLFGADPPRHTRLRAVLEPLFGEVIASAPQIAEATAGHLLDILTGTGRMELMQDYALPLPSAVLFTIMGIPQGHWPVLLQWTQSIAAAHDITQSLATRVQGATCSMALDTYLAEWVIQDRTTAATGLLGGLCRAVESGDLTREDVQVCGNDFLVAGYLSTTFLIGTGLVHLLEHPDQLAALRADPALVHGAVEEMLRMDAPAQLVDRVVSTDTALGGVELPAGTKVTAVLGSANRDPEAFADPDAFSVGRDHREHLAFGQGIHHCVGAPLVRLVTPVAITSLLALDDLAIAGLAQWQTDPYLRAMTSLPVSFSAR